MASEVEPFHKALRFGKFILENPLELAAVRTPQPSVSALEISAIFHHADTIPGMCDHEKIRALCELVRYCPSGDVVESAVGGANRHSYLRDWQFAATSANSCV
ncbi:MAG: hypothetical protein IPH54_12510 [Rhodoferax sp.]|nr:hypothetical protein [Rhodoferax sp.]